MEVHLPAGCGMPGRTPGRNDRLQDTAGTLGQGTDSNWKEDPAARVRQRRSTAHQSRSLVSPDGEHQLSADDHALGLVTASHDHSFLPGLVPNALHRPAAVYGVDVFDFELLPGFTARVVSAKLAAGIALSPVPHGARHWSYHHKHQGGDRSTHR